MREAFNYMFKDNKYKNKALIYFLYVLVANFCTYYANTLMPNCSGGCATNTTFRPETLLYMLIGFIFSLIPLGYYFTCIKGLIEQKENYILPNFNFTKNFVLGLKYAISNILAILVYGLGIAILIFGLTSQKYTCAIALALVVIVVVIIYSILSIAFVWIFSNTGWITSFLRIKRAFALIKSNSSTYWSVFGLLCVIGIVSMVVSFVGAMIGALTNSDIASSLISAICIAALSSYTAFVGAFLIAKSIKPVVETEA